MFIIRDENLEDVSARESLLDLAFGSSRFTKTCERLREGRIPAQGLALAVEHQGELVATVRLWHVTIGAVREALILGPLAVAHAFQSKGLGARLTCAVLNRASLAGHSAILLVGDEPYYKRFGFSRHFTDGIWLPGPVEGHRFLGLELQSGALSGAWGLVKASGDLVMPISTIEGLKQAA